MRGNIIKALVKSINNGQNPERFIISFFEEYADYRMNEKELEKSLHNALELQNFVAENKLKPGPKVAYRDYAGRIKYVQFDAQLPDGRRIIVENSDEYEVKKRLARAGDVIIRVRNDFTVEVVGVVE